MNSKYYQKYLKYKKKYLELKHRGGYYGSPAGFGPEHMASGIGFPMPVGVRGPIGMPVTGPGFPMPIGGPGIAIGGPGFPMPVGGPGIAIGGPNIGGISSGIQIPVGFLKDQIVKAITDALPNNIDDDIYWIELKKLFNNGTNMITILQNNNISIINSLINNYNNTNNNYRFSYINGKFILNRK